MESTPRSSKDKDRFFIDNTFFRGGWAGKLGPFAIAVYNAIALHADSESQEAWPSHATIAKLTGMSARQVIREVEQLESYNIVSVKSRQEERKPAIITLLDKSIWKPVDNEHMTGSHMGQQVTDSHKTDSHKASDSESDEHMTGSHTNKTQLTKPINKLLPNGNSGKKPQLPGNKSGPKNKSSPPPQAVQVYRSVANRFPDKATWGMIDTRVGINQEDLDFWKLVVRDYIACGFNKINIKTMLEYFDRRELPKTKQGKKGSRQNGQKTTGESEPGIIAAAQRIAGDSSERADSFAPGEDNGADFGISGTQRRGGLLAGY